MTAPAGMAPTMEPVIAAGAYLTRTMADRGIELSVGATPPEGEATRYVLLNQVDSRRRGFLADYLLRARVFNEDAYEVGQHTTMLHADLLGAAQVKVVFPNVGELWVTGTEHQAGPSDIDDPDRPLFGQAVAVFWTVALKPIREVTP